MVDRDGSHLERLTFDWASDILPRWSPQGTRIAFLSDHAAASFGSRVDSDVHVLDLASRVVRRVSPGDGDSSGFAWSPDGERIVLVRSIGRDGLGSLWLVDVDGGEPSLLHPGPVGWPSWSPDGTTLAVYTGPGADPRAPLEIGLVDIASGAVTALGAGADRPTWTGDGTYVVTSIETAAGFATVLFNARSGEQTILAVQASGRPSPDGAWFLYAERTNDLGGGAG
jgi:Tol biopolymer transport system component